MTEVVYVLCAVTSLFCAILLFRSHRRQRTSLLMWSTFGFAGLAINNVLLFVDLVLVRATDLSYARNGVALFALVLLLIGLIWEDR